MDHLDVSERPYVSLGVYFLLWCYFSSFLLARFLGFVVFRGFFSSVFGVYYDDLVVYLVQLFLSLFI